MQCFEYEDKIIPQTYVPDQQKENARAHDICAYLIGHVLQPTVYEHRRIDNRSPTKSSELPVRALTTIIMERKYTRYFRNMKPIEPGELQANTSQVTDFCIPLRETMDLQKRQDVQQPGDKACYTEESDGAVTVDKQK